MVVELNQPLAPSLPHAARKRGAVIGTFIDVLTWNEALDRLGRWSQARESRYVCICNVHSVVTARLEPDFMRIVNEADMATPDGMPVAWTLRRQGFVLQERINGPDLMWRYCELAAANAYPVYLYGSTEETSAALRSRLLHAFPGLVIAGAISPPFRALSAEEDEAIVEEINASGAAVVFVALGCPRQERWMAAHRGRVRAVLIGVGAAFDYHAGRVRRAPKWAQNAGLEWAFRLMSEPRRLWRRYLLTNVLFVFYSLKRFFRRT
jgi:N-acetylglucosaminyldiphosphoundecaprenol N-acetyl-beta-D-mannosaminyltransferase